MNHVIRNNSVNFIYALEQETEGLLEQIIGGGKVMKPASYPEYKDPRQPFLGDISAHWNLFRNDRLFSGNEAKWRSKNAEAQ